MYKAIYWNDANNLWSNDKNSVKWVKTNANVNKKNKSNNFNYNLTVYMSVICSFLLTFLLRIVEFYIIYEIISDFTFIIFAFLFAK